MMLPSWPELFPHTGWKLVLLTCAAAPEDFLPAALVIFPLEFRVSVMALPPGKMAAASESRGSNEFAESCVLPRPATMAGANEVLWNASEQDKGAYMTRKRVATLVKWGTCSCLALVHALGTWSVVQASVM
mmetsp:Transcript_96365/g.281571  ORF Transcript_96365/g.281571 Transcript_96365/m.281571 type:complete len:131 (+) Transcript_96365:352-744(+)